MDKNAIKKYAVWARNELIARVTQKAEQYEITEKKITPADADSIGGKLLTDAERKQRSGLITQVKEKGYEQVMEEVAYMWFNRFSALRFMEVNGFLPTHIRVFTNDDNAFKPQILDEAINMEMDGLDMQKVYDLKNANDDDALFKYMIIVQCNALSKILPGMFQRISDYTELLFPDNLLREGSVVEQMIAMIPQEDWTDQVQIIGWLYQYYNTEPKDHVFANLKKNIKISKENIPAATQLFTPDWIVRYMVENSLGRLWLEGHPNDDLKANWKYYLDEAEQEPEVQAQLAEIRKEYAALKPEDILAIDPCQGSGHILAYMFDVLVQIYEAYGYSAREAASSIVEHNIWGLDIDERAAQLAYFSVMMKARQYDRRFFSRGIQPHVYAIQESNNLDPYCIDYFVDGRKELKATMDTFVKELHDAKEYGSILNVTQVDFDALYSRFEEIRNEDVPGIYSYQTIDVLLPFVQMAQAMSQKYHVVVTNPPYMSSAGMSNQLSDYVKKHYPESKNDLFAVFIEKCMNMCVRNGLQAMITQHVWMFLASFQGLRERMLNVDTINMAHLGARAFDEIGGEVVQTTSFSLRNSNIKRYAGTYCRLIEPSSESGKEELFLSGNNRYVTQQDCFTKIPGYPVAYWVAHQIFEMMDGSKLEDYFLSAGRFKSCNDELYLRFWWEPTSHNTDWHCYCKGGDGRKYVGNEIRVLSWTRKSQEFYRNNGGVGNRNYWETEGITWATITTSTPTFRIKPAQYFWSSSAPTIFQKTELSMRAVLAYLNSKPAEYLLDIFNPTASLTVADVLKLPYRMKWESQHCIDLCIKGETNCRADWNSFEISNGFMRHPLVQKVESIDLANHQWEEECNNRFESQKRIEEEINRIFITEFGLQNELSFEVNDKDVSIRKPDLQRDIRSLISYAVGCMFGRYSLDIPGLLFAGGEWDDSKYTTFQPDKDAILPICDDEYFEDDIVGRFVKFVETVYGKDTLEENLRFIADALGGKGSSREVIRNYFINDFYADHLKVYQKRPIYWLFDSGKKNGFKCLIYIHRYQPDTIARIRTDYVHEQQSRYRTAMADLEQRINSGSTSERVKLSKQLATLQAQAEEIRVYEEKIHHLADQMIKINLDDGVKHNYEIFKDVLAKIK